METYRNPQFDALGDGTRRAILEQLLDGPLPVGKLAAKFPVSRPAISQHLKVLEQSRLVIHTATGTRHVYQLNPEGFDSLRQYLDRFWSQALLAFRKKAEEVK